MDFVAVAFEEFGGVANEEGAGFWCLGESGFGAGKFRGVGAFVAEIEDKEWGDIEFGGLADVGVVMEAKGEVARRAFNGVPGDFVANTREAGQFDEG
ncbi:hypothetical protein [Geminisphaera colitermitum]|uniref:hypothetical protein n=1 Tax=Geminisphaera colitermitum TaxID=1148786 RepID=UPI0012FECD4A|nr:hypothetical protein [Geminisphaera colitermitum]